MDGSFRKYLSSKSSILSFRSSSQPSLDSDFQSVAYDSTRPGPRVPIFISQPLRRSMTEQRLSNLSGGLAIRSFSYESASSGKAPIIGGRPHRGNGPVKLQTSRRLSSGELLVTSQDSRRTLEDIREGEYIIGGVGNRSSRSSQVRSPTPSLPSPLDPPNKFSRWRPSSRMSASFRQSSHGRSVSAADYYRESRAQYLLSRSPSTQPASSSTPSSRHGSETNPDAGDKVYGLALTTSPSPELPIEAAPTQQSASQNHDQLISAEALRKAERARLSALQRHAQHDRDSHPRQTHFGRTPLACSSLEQQDSTAVLGQDYQPPPLKLSDQTNEASTNGANVEPSRGFLHESDDTSDYSSHRRSSFISSNASSSSFTVRTSIFEDNPNTREEVHRLVDNMRSNYLKAIDEKTTDQSPQIVRSIINQPQTSLPLEVVRSKKHQKQRKVKRQSWQSSDITASRDMNAWRWASDPSDVPDIAMDSEESRNPLEGEAAQPKLERADSMTLGSLMAPSRSPRTSQKQVEVAEPGPG